MIRTPKPRTPRVFAPSTDFRRPPTPRPQTPGGYGRTHHDSAFFDYSDPFQLNSIADVVLTTFNPDMERGNYGGLEKIPVLNLATGLLDLFHGHVIKPIQQAEYAAIAMNAMINLGETMNIPHNMLKGFLFEGTEGALDAMGLGSWGRRNFDFDTGNKIQDFALEVVTDPMNWVMMFSKPLSTPFVKNTLGGDIRIVMGTGYDDMVKDIGKRSADDLVDILSGRSVNIYYQNKGDKGINECMQIALKTMGPGMSEATIRGAQKVLPANMIKILTETQNIVKHATAIRVLKGISSSSLAADAYQKAMLTGATWSSGLAPMSHIIRRGRDSINNYFKTMQAAHMEKWKRPNGGISFVDYYALREVHAYSTREIEVVSRLAHVGGVNLPTANYIMRESADLDIQGLQKLIGEYRHEPRKFLAALKLYMDANHDGKTIQELLDIVKDINRGTGDAFINYERHLDDILNLHGKVLEHVNIRETATTMNSIRVQYDKGIKAVMNQSFPDHPLDSLMDDVLDITADQIAENMDAPPNTIRQLTERLRTHEITFINRLRDDVTQEIIKISERYPLQLTVQDFRDYEMVKFIREYDRKYSVSSSWGRTPQEATAAAKRRAEAILKEKNRLLKFQRVPIVTLSEAEFLAKADQYFTETFIKGTGFDQSPAEAQKLIEKAKIEYMIGLRENYKQYKKRVTELTQQYQREARLTVKTAKTSIPTTERLHHISRNRMDATFGKTPELNYRAQIQRDALEELFSFKTNRARAQQTYYINAMAQAAVITQKHALGRDVVLHFQGIAEEVFQNAVIQVFKSTPSVLAGMVDITKLLDDTPNLEQQVREIMERELRHRLQEVGVKYINQAEDILNRVFKDISHEAANTYSGTAKHLLEAAKLQQAQFEQYAKTFRRGYNEFVYLTTRDFEENILKNIREGLIAGDMMDSLATFEKTWTRRDALSELVQTLKDTIEGEHQKKMRLYEDIISMGEQAQVRNALEEKVKIYKYTGDFQARMQQYAERKAVAGLDAKITKIATTQDEFQSSVDQITAHMQEAYGSVEDLPTILKRARDEIFEGAKSQALERAFSEQGFEEVIDNYLQWQFRDIATNPSGFTDDYLAFMRMLDMLEVGATDLARGSKLSQTIKKVNKSFFEMVPETRDKVTYTKHKFKGQQAFDRILGNAVQRSYIKNTDQLIEGMQIYAKTGQTNTLRMTLETMYFPGASPNMYKGGISQVTSDELDEMVEELTSFVKGVKLNLFRRFNNDTQSMVYPIDFFSNAIQNEIRFINIQAVQHSKRLGGDFPWDELTEASVITKHSARKLPAARPKWKLMDSVRPKLGSFDTPGEPYKYMTAEASDYTGQVTHSNALEKMMLIMQTHHPLQQMRQMYKVEANRLSYIQKFEQVTTFFWLMTGQPMAGYDAVEPIFQHMYMDIFYGGNNNPVGETIRDIMVNFREGTALHAAASAVMEDSKNYHRIYQFMDHLASTPFKEGEMMYDALLSTLLHPSFAKLPRDQFMNNFERYSRDVIENVNNYIQGRTLKQSYSLETWVAEGRIKNMPPGITLENLHGAMNDSLVTKAVALQEFPEIFSDPDILFLFADIETMGLDKALDTILQMAISPHNGTKEIGDYQIIRKLGPGDSKPGQALIESLYKHNRNLTYAEKMKLFEDTYAAGTANTEVEVLRNFIEKLHEFKAANPGKKIKMVLQNGDDFDIPFIRTRIARAVLEKQLPQQYMDSFNAFFKHSEPIDTLSLFRKREGLFKLTRSHPDHDNIRTLLRSLGRGAQSDSGKGLRLLDPVNNESLTNVEELLRLIDYEGNELEGVLMAKSRLGNLDTLSEIGSTTSPSPHFALRDAMQKYQADTRDTLFHIGMGNRQMARAHIDAGFLKQGETWTFYKQEIEQSLLRMAPADMNDIQKAMVAELKAGGEITDALFESVYGKKYLNMTKYLYADFAGDQMYGYRKVDHNQLLNFFKVQADELAALSNTEVMEEVLKNPRLATEMKVFTGEVLERMARSSRRINDIRSSIRNPYLIDHVQWDIDITLKAIINMPELNEIAAYKAYLRLMQTDHADPYTRYAMLQYLYELIHFDTERNATLLHYFDKNMSDGLREILTIRRKELYQTPLDTLGRVNMHKYGKNILTDVADLDNYRQFMVDMGALDAHYTDLAEVYTNNALTRATALGYAEAAREIQEMYRYIGKEMDKLNSAGQTEFTQMMQRTYQDYAMAASRNIMTMAPEALAQHMAHKAPFMVISAIDFLENAEYRKVYEAFMGGANDLRAAGVEVYLQGEIVYLGLSNKKQLQAKIISHQLQVTWGDELMAPQPLSRVELLGYKGTDHRQWDLADYTNSVLKKINNYTDGGGNSSMLDTLHPEKFQQMYANLPEAFRNNIIPLEDMMNPALWGSLRFNYSYLGKSVPGIFGGILPPGNIADRLLQSTDHYIRYGDKFIFYREMFMDSTMDINTGTLAGMDDLEIYTLLRRHSTYTLASLLQDPTTGKMIAYRYDLTDVNVIAEARKQGAVLMSLDTYKKAHNVIQNRMMTEPARNAWQKVMYAYKAGFLLDPGVWFRNWIDSTLKTMVASGGQIGKAIGYQLKAFELLNDYNGIVGEVIRMDGAYRMYKPDNLDLYFSGKLGQPKISRALYDELHQFLMDGPSAGIMGTRWESYFPHTNGKNLKDAWQTFVHYSGRLMVPNAYIEQMNRLAYYMILQEKGLNTVNIFADLARVHFDYSYKTDMERAMELVFPFYTFTMRNLDFWVDAVAEQPWIAEMFWELTKTSWDIPNMNAQELSLNRSLQYNVLNGTLPLPQNLTLKTNYSAMDAFRVITNPLGAFESRLAPPFKTILDSLTESLEGEGVDYYRKMTGSGGASLVGLNGDRGMRRDRILGNIPVVGAFNQRYSGVWNPEEHTHYQRTDNELTRFTPGIVGSVARWRDQSRGRSFAPRVPRARTRMQRQFRGQGRIFNRDMSVPKTYWKQDYRGRWYRFGFFQRAQTQGSIYEKHYTKTGKSRMQLRVANAGRPYSKYRLKDLHHYLK